MKLFHRFRIKVREAGHARLLMLSVFTKPQRETNIERVRQNNDTKSNEQLKGL